jgi:hypothetical protein
MPTAAWAALAPAAHTRKAHANRRPIRIAADLGHLAPFIG